MWNAIDSTRARVAASVPGVCPSARRLPHPAGDFVQWLRHQRITDLLAGASTGDQACASVVPVLSDRYRVIVPDLRGHGRSTCAPETIRLERFAADLVALLDHLGIERAHLVGHSGGAETLQVLGTRHLPRARTLTLVGSERPLSTFFPAGSRTWTTKFWEMIPCCSARSTWTTAWTPLSWLCGPWIVT